MFDPFHNAINNYYLVNGDLSGASLEKDVIVMNWNFDKRAESLKHFAERGHQQVIAGYYDADPAQINQWLDAVVKEKVPNVIGVMYTTWANNHGDLEKFGQLVKAHA